MKLRALSCTITLSVIIVFGVNCLHAQNSSVKGTGTAGHITKWLDDKTIGDSGIIESAGNIGIGTSSPASKLTVVGAIEASVRTGIAVQGSSSQGTGVKAISNDGIALHAISTNFDAIFAVSTNGAAGVFIGEVNVTNTKPGVAAVVATNTADFGTGLIASGGGAPTGIGGIGISGGGGDSNTGPGGNGVQGFGGASNGAGPAGTGVLGTGGFNTTGGPNGVGVTGFGGASTFGSGGTGMVAHGGSGFGAGQVGGTGVEAFAGPGSNGATKGVAGIFHGDVIVGGTLTKGGGSFKIDHPLEPQNKYLYHSFVESPDMMNIYNGNITTNEKGEALVELPPYFQALNRDFRYQLTVIGTFAQAIVAEKVKDNRFSIKTSAPNVEVSWQITGIRQDAWANANRIKVEEDKPQNQRGTYLYPELFPRRSEVESRRAN